MPEGKIVEFDQKQQEIILRSVFNINVSFGREATTKDLMNAVPRNIDEIDILPSIQNIKAIIDIGKYEFVVNKKEAIMKVLASVEYKIEYPSLLSNQDELEKKRHNLALALIELDKKMLEGEELMAAIMEYADLQDEVVKIISTAKEAILAEDYLANNINNLIITDSYLRVFCKEKFAELRGKKSYYVSTAIETVLNMIYSTGLVFMGKYRKADSSFEYFYFDIALLNRQDNFLLDRIKKLSLVHKDKKELDSIASQIKGIYDIKIIEYYKDELAKMQTELADISDNLHKAEYKDNKENMSTVHNQYQRIRNNFIKLKNNLRAERLTTEAFQNIEVVIATCARMLQDVEKELSAVPSDFINYLNSKKSMFNIYNDYDLEPLIYKCTFLRADAKGKNELLKQMWQEFLTHFSFFLRSIGLKLEEVHVDGLKKEVIRFHEYYIVHNISDNLCYIYSNLDSHVEFNRNTDKLMMKPAGWTVNRGRFLHMISAMEVYLFVKDLMLKFFEALEKGEI